MATIEEQTMLELSRRMRDLNKDIVIEILSWVPANSLLRWRSVCKYWFALIKKPSFIQKHLHHSMISHDPSVLISSPYSRGFDVQCYLNYTTGSFSNPKQIFSHPFKPYRPSMDQITSVNGLLFCHRYDQKRYCIWNPCTKEYKLLPEPPFIKFDKHQERLVSQYGFGYDQTINDYKLVVRNEYEGNCLLSEVQVYTVGTNSWRNITPIPKELRTRLPCGVFMNGAVHWLHLSGMKIISFDIEKENFKEILIKQPKCSHGRWIHTMELQAFKGSLCCHVELTIDDPAKTCLEMWMMSDCKVNNNESSWTKLFGTLLYDYYWLKLILTTTNGEIIMLNRVKDFVLSDPETQTIRTHGRICETLECQDRRRLEAAVYIESLVSLNSGTYYASPDG